MTAMPSRRPVSGLTKKQQQFRRDELVGIEHAIQFHEPLTQVQRLVLMRILIELLDCRDPRAELGIPKKQGRRSSKAGFHKWMAGHYWHLRWHEHEKDVTARAIVADAWGVSASQVWKVAQPMRGEWKQNFGSGDFEQVMNAVDSLIPLFKQLSAKSR